MNVKNITISILIGLFLVSAAPASAQYVGTAGGDQIYVNQPASPGQPGYIVPPASMMPVPMQMQMQMPVPEAANPAMPCPIGGFGQPYPYAAPCAAAPGPGLVPFAAPAPAPIGPFTGGFEYSAQQASAFGPFTPPVTQAAEQYYQYPGLTPYGPYPGAGYAAEGGVGFDPVSGYYGPYGGAVPLV